MRWPWRVLQVALVVALLVALVTVATRQGRAAFKTVLLVPQIVPGIPVKPQSWFTRKPLREDVRFPLRTESTPHEPASEPMGIADLYRLPGGGKRAAVVMFLGVNPAGRDDPRVVNLSEGLARAGFVVMVPWSDVMTQSRLDVNSPEELVAAFQYLSALPYVDSARVGLAGFCVGSSIAAVAAEDPRINEKVAFVNFFGGYYDARDYLVQLASKTSFYKDTSEPWRRGDLAETVFINEMISMAPEQSDRDLLARVYQQGQPATEQEVAGLSFTGSVVYRLLGGVSLEEARRLEAQLPAGIQDELARISPSVRIADLKAPVLIMQDREDDAVPVEESQRLYDAIGGRDNVSYTVFSFFQHVDPSASVPPLTFVREAWKLFRHLDRIVMQAT